MTSLTLRSGAPLALAALVLATLGGAPAVRAQNAAAPAATAPAAPEPSPEALRLATDIVAKTSTNRDATIKAMSAPLASMMQQFGIREPDRARILVDEVVSPMLSQHIDELFRLQARSYATTLSVETLKGVDDFYGSPAGRDLIALQPQLASTLLSNTTLWLRGLAPELQTRMQAAIQAHNWEPAGAAPKK